jgi:hypothetical protein
MDNSSSLQKLATEKLAVLNDEQKAIFCMLDPKDQDFFSTSFGPKDLPVVLMKKADIIKRNQSTREKLEAIQASIARSAAAEPTHEKADDIFSAVGLAVGAGAAAAAVVTDNSAFWQGVKPGDLIGPLKSEFNNANTRLDISGNGDVQTLTVMLLERSNNAPYMNPGAGVAALSINLAAVNNGTEVKTSDLTAQGTLETIKAGGQKLLNMAEQAVGILGKAHNGNASPVELVSAANQAFSNGTGLAEIAGNLKLKERAWKVIQETADAIESNYTSEMEKIKKARFELEKSWDDYYNCPQCRVSFDGPICRVCGTSRPEKPLQPDPRQQ